MTVLKVGYGSKSMWIKKNHNNQNAFTVLKFSIFAIYLTKNCVLNICLERTNIYEPQQDLKSRLKICS